MPEYAFIRELHVYSHVNCTIDEIENTESQQHRGYGAMLLQHAEAICYQKGYYAVISKGVLFMLKSMIINYIKKLVKH